MFHKKAKSEYSAEGGGVRGSMRAVHAEREGKREGMLGASVEYKKSGDAKEGTRRRLVGGGSNQSLVK